MCVDTIAIGIPGVRKVDLCQSVSSHGEPGLIPEGPLIGKFKTVASLQAVRTAAAAGKVDARQRYCLIQKLQLPLTASIMSMGYRQLPSFGSGPPQSCQYEWH